MRQNLPLFVLLLYILIFTNCAKTPESQTGPDHTYGLSIECKEHITLATTGYYAKYKYTPQIYKSCPTGEVHITQTSPYLNNELFPIGETRVDVKATDDCGNIDSCAYYVKVINTTNCNGSTGPSDFRNLLVGTYRGTRTCGSDIVPDYEVFVCYHPDYPNELVINNDNVPIDSTCTCFSWPFIYPYRVYQAYFQNSDTLKIVSRVDAPLGNPVQPPTCTFIGTKH